MGRASRLDGKHTIFGQVVLGHEVAVAISEVPTDAEDRPKTPWGRFQTCRAQTLTEGIGENHRYQTIF